MTAAIVHSLLAAGACAALWWLWRRWFGGAELRVRQIVALGFLARAFAGQILFWISFLRLPVARSMHFGSGYWFFALDGAAYVGYANELLARGAAAFNIVHGSYPSRAFVQILAVFIALFGSVASVALLLNLLAYLATCTFLARMQPRAGGALLFALAVVAFEPAMLLWSLQPLKDTVFTCVVAALIFLLFRWGERPRLWIAAALWVLFFALATLRWYFALILWGALPLFFLSIALRVRRIWTFAAGIALFIVVSQAIRLGGATDVSPYLRPLLDPREAISGTRKPQVTVALDAARSGFEHTPGRTTFTPGPALGASASPRPSAPIPRPRKHAPPPPSTASQRVARVVSGSAAALLPRTIGQRLGLFEVGGGRGLWLFAEADTLVFDAILVAAFVYCVRARRRVTALFAFVLLVFLATGGPLVYTVNNLGTLLRLREMLCFTAALLPLTLALATPASEPGCR